MPVLRNQRHEIFAQGVASGLSAAEAYVKAGYKPSRKNASRLRTKEDVDARIAELSAAITTEVQKRTGLTKEWVLERLEQVVERCMQHEEIIRDNRPTGEYVFNAPGANKALELIGKELGMFVERKETANRHYLIADRPMTEEEWDKAHLIADDSADQPTAH